MAINLRLLVDTKTNKVAYAEAKKDFVDFLFGLLQLPIGTVLSLLAGRGKVGPGSLAQIQSSVKKLDNDYLQSDRTRNALLSPYIIDENSSNPSVKLLAPKQSSRTFNLYSSSSSQNVVEGHVKGVVTYMVMDDLSVEPMSTISSIKVINNMRVKDFGSLDEMNVVVDMDQGLELLKASFVSTTVLSDVFLPKVQLQAKEEGMLEP